MTTDLYRYQFAAEVPTEEIETTLLLSLFAVESLHGESQTRLDAMHHFDADRCACVIDAGPDVGRDFNRLFVGFLRRAFGEHAFQVERLREKPAMEPVAPGA